MRWLGLGLVMLGLWSAGCASPASPAWIRFTSRPGKFHLDLPGRPQEQVATMRTRAGKIRFTTYTLEDDAYAFMSGYCDYPKGMLRAGPQRLRLILSGARDAALRNARGTLLAERDITVKGHPGREFTFAIPGGAHAKERLILVRNRLYQVMAMHKPGAGTESALDRHLQSFGFN